MKNGRAARAEMFKMGARGSAVFWGHNTRFMAGLISRASLGIANPEKLGARFQYEQRLDKRTICVLI